MLTILHWTRLVKGSLSSKIVPLLCVSHPRPDASGEKFDYSQRIGVKLTKVSHTNMHTITVCVCVSIVSVCRTNGEK